MAVAGRKPSENPRHRSKPTHEWVEVEDVPFEGPWPELPETRTVVTKDGPVEVSLQPLTLRWWDTIKRMPHAKLWSEAQWMYAVMTAMVADKSACGTASADTELRNREKHLGVTMDQLRDLRIRYVPVGEVREELAEVRSIDSVRDL